MCHSCLYVSLMALLLIVIGGVVTAFMYPRSVIVSVADLHTMKFKNDVPLKFLSEPNNKSDVLLQVEVSTFFN